MVKMNIWFCRRDKSTINLDINPKRGGSPAKDSIKDIIIKALLEFFCVSINKWSPEDCLRMLSSGREIRT